MPLTEPSPIPKSEDSGFDKLAITDLAPMEQYAHDPFLLGMYDPSIYDAQSFKDLVHCVTKLRNLDLSKRLLPSQCLEFQDALADVVLNIKVPDHTVSMRLEQHSGLITSLVRAERSREQADQRIQLKADRIENRKSTMHIRPEEYRSTPLYWLWPDHVMEILNGLIPKESIPKESIALKWELPAQITSIAEGESVPEKEGSFEEVRIPFHGYMLELNSNIDQKNIFDPKSIRIVYQEKTIEKKSILNQQSFFESQEQEDREGRVERRKD